MPGTYTISYRAIDDTGNVATANRTVTVTAAVTQTPPVTSTPDTNTSTESESTDTEITDIQKNASELVVTYADNTSTTFKPYGSSSNFRYVPSVDKKRLIVTNGKDVRVFVNGERVAKKVISKKTLPRTAYRVTTQTIYDEYDSVFIASVSKNIARVHAFRLTADDALTKYRSQQFTAANFTNPVVSVNTKKKQVTVTYGKSGQRAKHVWKLKSNGDFSLLQ